jgi:hypothetical protein
MHINVTVDNIKFGRSNIGSTEVGGVGKYMS